MNIARTKIMGSIYVGLFGLTNDELCFLPTSITEKNKKIIEDTLDVKGVTTTLYASPLLSVFAKMNNKHAYLPQFVNAREIEKIEQEIKIKIIKTELALGNLIELNDNGIIASNTLSEKVINELKETKISVAQTNIGDNEVTGSNIVATNKGFLVNPNINPEEIKKIETTLNVKGGSSTANTGDYFVRNSVLANTKGIIVGEGTTPFEINRIEEALE